VTPLQIYAIHLARATERRGALEAELLRLGQSAEFIAACDGHAPDFSFSAHAHLLLPGQQGQSFKPGAFACFLSHSYAWQRIAEGPAPHALVIEDDVVFNPPAFEAALAGPLPEGFDVLFVNYRMYKLAAAAGWRADFSELNDPDQWMDRALAAPRPSAGRPAGPAFVPVSDTLATLFAARYYRDPWYATGGDGYIVSQAGARRLLEMMHTRKIRMGVDYAMVLNSLSPALIRELPDEVLAVIPGICRNFILRERQAAVPPGPMGLKSYIHALDWLVGVNTEMNFPSTIRHKVLKPI
jgi:GR25 family glycosyltransferase involved in LPS biosynthesis